MAESSPCAKVCMLAPMQGIKYPIIHLTYLNLLYNKESNPFLTVFSVIEQLENCAFFSCMVRCTFRDSAFVFHSVY